MDLDPDLNNLQNLLGFKLDQEAPLVKKVLKIHPFDFA